VQVPDDPAAADVNHVLSDVRAVVGDALEVLSDHDVRQVRLGARPVAFELAEDFLHDLAVQRVYGVVAPQPAYDAGKGLESTTGGTARRDVVSGLAGDIDYFPQDASRTMNSTRRFFSLPSGVVLSAMGLSSP